MNPEETYEAVHSGVADALEKAAEGSRRIMRITEFDAVDDEDTPVRVVGIVDNGDQDLQFVALADDDGEISPFICGSVFRLQEGQPRFGEAVRKQE